MRADDVMVRSEQMVGDVYANVVGDVYAKVLCADQGQTEFLVARHPIPDPGSWSKQANSW